MLKTQLLEMFAIGPEFPDSRRFDPVTAIMGGISAGTSVIGGIKGSSAAKKAAEAQSLAAQKASDTVGVATGDANRGIADATASAQQLATAGGQGVLDASGKAAAGVTGAAGQANLLLNPYADAGGAAAAQLQGEMGNFGKMPTLAELQMDPGYEFRRQQAELAMQRSGAAKGGALGGGALKDAMAFNSGLASQEYQNAFNRFRTSQQDRFGNLFQVAGMGRDAAGQQGANLTGAASTAGGFQMRGAEGMLGANQFAASAGMQGAGQIGDNTMRGAMAQGDFMTQKGNAQAAGQVGAANAWNGALGGVANAATGAATMNYLKNPATSGYYSSSRGRVK